MSPPRLAVVGAGAAGMSAAAWLHGLDLSFAWFEAEPEPGGTLRRVGNPLTNFPGAPASGAALADQLSDWTRSLGLVPRRASTVGVTYTERGWRIEGAHAGAAEVDRLLLCTGTRPRLLGLPDEAALVGRGVEVSVTRNLARYAGQEVVVIGGGDAACEGALLLASVCPRVYLIHRGPRLRAQRRFVDRLRSAAHVSVVLEREVQGLELDGLRLGGVRLSDGTRRAATGVFVRIGVAPCVPTGVPPDVLAPDGYIRADVDGVTARPGLFAAGDVTSGAHQSAAWAIGAGARAADAMARSLVTLRG